MALTVGEKLGPYEITGRVGKGGMGEVYRARDSRLGREVAVKVLPPEAMADPVRRARFETEARAASALNHPNILGIYDFGEHEGAPYIVSELVEGETLRAVMDRGPMGARQVLEIAAQVADGFAAAHDARITHRDLKPDNVMLTRDGRAKILDFGLAKFEAAARSGDATMTMGAFVSEPGLVMGTVAYMSPEQARAGDVDYRTDQFSLGVMLHEMLTGKQPFTRETAPETMTAILKEEAPPLEAAVPGPLRWVVERLLAKNREERYTSTRDLYRELRTLRERLFQAQSNATEAVRPVAARAGGRWWVWAVAGAAVAGLAAGVMIADRPAVDLEKLVYTPLASGAFATESLAWASDGKGFLVAGDGQLLRYPLDGGAPLELLREGRQADGIYPAPDGRAVYFTAPVNRERSLLSVSAAGGKAELVYPLGGFLSVKGVAISPDGKWIVVSRFNEKGEGRLAYASPIGAPLQDYPHAIDWSSTTRHVLRFSPDGKRLLLIAGWPPSSARPAEAYLIPWPPTSAAPRKIPMERDWWRMNATWLPDGRNLLAMSSARFGSGYRFMMMGDDFQNQQLLGSGDSFDTRTVAVHADGRALLAESAQDHNTVAIPLDGGPIRSLGSDFLDESFPSWMPDGEQYAQFINRRGNQQIWMMRKDGTPLRMLAGEINAAAGLAVSPDGRQITFSADGVVYVVPVSGGTPIRIEEGLYPSWSPDSESLVFGRGEVNSSQLRKIRLGASAKSESFGAPELRFGSSPVWSPDGRWIAVTGEAKVYLYSSDGKEQRVLENDPGRSMVWARDSRFLYFHRRENELIQVTLDGKERVVRDLGEVRLRYQIPETMSISPDGKTLLGTERRSKTRVVLVEGLRAPRRIWERWLDGGAR